MTTQNEHAPSADIERGKSGSVRQLGSDVLTLAELQADLLQADLREWGRAFVRGVAALVAALVFALASVPVLLLSLGYYLAAATELSLSTSMLIAAAVSVAIAAIFGTVGAMLLKREQPMLHRFRSELRHNVRWLKEMLTQPLTATRSD